MGERIPDGHVKGLRCWKVSGRWFLSPGRGRRGVLRALSSGETATANILSAN
jgi:hypothetical protein